jgi:hypothetical protein
MATDYADDVMLNERNEMDEEEEDSPAGSIDCCCCYCTSDNSVFCSSAAIFVFGCLILLLGIVTLIIVPPARCHPLGLLVVGALMLILVGVAIMVFSCNRIIVCSNDECIEDALRRVVNHRVGGRIVLGLCIAFCLGLLFVLVYVVVLQIRYGCGL